MFDAVVLFVMVCIAVLVVLVVSGASRTAPSPHRGSREVRGRPDAGRSRPRCWPSWGLAPTSRSRPCLPTPRSGPRRCPPSLRWSG